MNFLSTQCSFSIFTKLRLSNSPTLSRNEGFPDSEQATQHTSQMHQIPQLAKITLSQPATFSRPTPPAQATSTALQSQPNYRPTTSTHLIRRNHYTWRAQQVLTWQQTSFRSAPRFHLVLTPLFALPATQIASPTVPELRAPVWMTCSSYTCRDAARGSCGGAAAFGGTLSGCLRC